MRVIDRLVVATVLLTSVAGSLSCQSASPSASPTFQTVSIEHSVNTHTRGRLQVEPDAILGTNTTLKRLISYAYDEQEPLIVGPRWIQTKGYDIAGRANGPVGDAQLRLMLQNALRDRFKTVVHRETKEIPVYLLVAADHQPR